MLDNGDGTVSPVDMTEYETAGDKFGAKDVNAITKMVNCTGDAFDPERDYEVGDYAIHENTVWKFTTAHPAGAWDESHVEKTRILVEIAEQNKNFVKLDEKTLIHVDRQPSLKPAMNATTKLSEYGNLPNGKYRVVARAQILNIYPVDMQSWLIIAPSNITPETGFDNGISFPANTSYSSVQMEQPIDITNEAKEINVYMYMFLLSPD